MKAAPRAAAAAVVALSLTGAACSISVHEDPPTTRTQQVELDHAESISVELKVGAGELAVQGGASKLMEGTFTFSPKALDPVVKYETVASHGRLRIEAPDAGMNFHPKEDWDVHLNNDKPTDLSVHFGAGEGRLELGTLNLRGVKVEMGVGQLSLDLRGSPKHDYAVEVRGGVGEATIYLPQDVGIYADVKGGIGDINAGGLENRDGHYVNAAYGVSPTTVRLDIRGGVGSIKLITN